MIHHAKRRIVVNKLKEIDEELQRIAALFPHGNSTAESDIRFALLAAADTLDDAAYSLKATMEGELQVVPVDVMPSSMLTGANMLTDGGPDECVDCGERFTGKLLDPYPLCTTCLPGRPGTPFNR